LRGILDVLLDVGSVEQVGYQGVSDGDVFPFYGLEND